MKPTLGRVPYTNIEPQTLLRAIHVGPMARSVDDIALGLSIMAGPDGIDVYAPPVPVQDYSDIEAVPPGVKIGWSPTAGTPVDPEVQKVVEEAANALAELGLNVEATEIPALAEKDAGLISSKMYLPEAGHHMESIIMGRESDLTELLRQRYVDSPPVPFEEYLEAGVMWEELKREVAEYFSRYDLFICPTVPMPA